MVSRALVRRCRCCRTDVGAVVGVLPDWSAMAGLMGCVVAVSIGGPCVGAEMPSLPETGHCGGWLDLMRGGGVGEPCVGAETPSLPD